MQLPPFLHRLIGFHSLIAFALAVQKVHLAHLVLWMSLFYLAHNCPCLSGNTGHLSNHGSDKCNSVDLHSSLKSDKGILDFLE